MDKIGNPRRVSAASTTLPHQFCVACQKLFPPDTGGDIYCETCKKRCQDWLACDLCRLQLPSVKAGVHCIYCRAANLDSDSDISQQQSPPRPRSDKRRSSSGLAATRGSDPMPTLNSPVSNPMSPPTGMTAPYVATWGPPPMTPQEAALVPVLTPADLELTADVEVEINRSREMDGLRQVMGMWRNMAYTANRSAMQRRGSHAVYQVRAIRQDQEAVRRSL